MSKVKFLCFIHLLFSVCFFQAVLQRGTFVKRVCVSMELSVRISGTHTPATVLKAVEERTVNKVCTLFSSIIVIFFLHFAFILLIHTLIASKTTDGRQRNICAVIHHVEFAVLFQTDSKHQTIRPSSKSAVMLLPSLLRYTFLFFLA